MKPLYAALFSFILCISCIVIAPKGATAQSIGGTIMVNPETEDEETAPGEERPAIEDFSDKVILRPYLLVPMNFLVISQYNSSRNYKTDDLTYLPNPTLCAGLGVSWWIIGLSFHTALVPLRDTDDYGKTQFIDLQFNFYFRRFGFDLFYQRYKGYSLNNAGDYSLVRGEPGAVRPDLTISTIGGNFFYIFSDGFSYNAAFKQTERQNVSGGSFLLMLSVININIDANYSLIPPTEEAYYGYNAGFQSGNFTSIGISPGYAHTFIFRGNFYMTPSLCLGTGLMRKSYDRYAGEKTVYGSFIKFNFRFAAGYNGDRWFYGLALVIDGTSSMSALGGAGISASTFGGFLEGFAGYRI